MKGDKWAGVPGTWFLVPGTAGNLGSYLPNKRTGLLIMRVRRSVGPHTTELDSINARLNYLLLIDYQPTM